MVLKITRQDGIPAGGGKKYTLINKALHSIIKQFIIKINEALTIRHSSLQCLHLNHTEFNRAGQKVLFNKSSVLQRQSQTCMEEVDSAAENNISLKKRGVFANNGTEVGLVGVPLCDIFDMDKLLLDGLEIKVKGALNSDAFVPMGDEMPMQTTAIYKSCPHSRQHDGESFANNARSERPCCPPSILHLDQNHKACIDHSLRGIIKTYRERAFQRSYPSMPYFRDGVQKCIQWKPHAEPFQFSTVRLPKSSSLYEWRRNAILSFRPDTRQKDSWI